LAIAITFILVELLRAGATRLILSADFGDLAIVRTIRLGVKPRVNAGGLVVEEVGIGR